MLNYLERLESTHDYIQKNDITNALVPEFESSKKHVDKVLPVFRPHQRYEKKDGWASGSLSTQPLFSTLAADKRVHVLFEGDGVMQTGRKNNANSNMQSATQPAQGTYATLTSSISPSRKESTLAMSKPFQAQSDVVMKKAFGDDDDDGGALEPGGGNDNDQGYNDAPLADGSMVLMLLIAAYALLITRKIFPNKF